MDKNALIAESLKDALENGVFGNPVKAIADGSKQASSANVKILILSLVNSIKGKVGGLTTAEMVAACGDMKIQFDRKDPDHLLGRAMAQRFISNINQEQEAADTPEDPEINSGNTENGSAGE